MYRTVIGLEIHTQLLTKTKAFCNCSADHFETEVNKNVCPVCSGQPGSLPVLNESAVKLAVMAGVALNGKINKISKFDRKNYFYPDLPKGYQITQYFTPIIEDAFIEINGHKIRIKRIHMEEDTGKMLHEGDAISSASESLIDYNRAGIPLIEIVTEPDIKSPSEAREFMERLRNILRYANISSGDMEKGALRCDANISIVNEETGESSKRVEVKNINSFKFVEKALEYERERLIEIMDKKEPMVQETRGWDANNKKTFSMRTKEEEADYRYFPEPDLPILEVDDEFIEEVKKDLPELPKQKQERFVEQYGIPEYDAGVLVSSKELADFYEECAKKVPDGKFLSNWFMGDMTRIMKEREEEVEDLKLTPDHFKKLFDLIKDGKISTKIAKDIFEEVYDGKDPEDIVKEKGLEQIDDDKMLEDMAREILANNEKNVEKYKNGKTNLLGFFVGQVMKQTKGKANPAKVNKIFVKLLNE
ncbi:Asp-tRNA(Asn)/Glu-tRNA(Gln) amidotransferase subunit GatB [Geotoga petraea]|jgi:aspartyl-tRNA(Asn)/glutamyl-tRNA(Gln) amidotransferase subunit B|uniref:Aspartyl/glutamyl-tRNA(Asn/Gln) amidotransferase subunit B n=1 Tax=Geotoga petraea TaxID=28234 RepID=A0A1G6MW39_9BACT|nr:Asp-tRNA(Asn)/Glu-tRNA(Gln) amidotransferase subunit GatB [Geotoga petraea]SDC59818.1 aspartyl/glutamyl-tRNA(Asn/Gln) amidotransferase subunit B [Geotoga petraea]